LKSSCREEYNRNWTNEDRVLCSVYSIKVKKTVTIFKIMSIQRMCMSNKTNHK